MGLGLPAAIGAAIAEPETRVVCFTGDGSLLMNIQELATLAELNLDVKIVLLDNGSLGLVRQQQELFYGQRYFAAHYRQSQDFVAIARAFGLRALSIDCETEFDAQLQFMLSIAGPALIRVPISNRHNVSPMVGPGAANV